MLKEEVTLHLHAQGVVVEERDGLLSKMMLPAKGEFNSHDELVEYAALVGQAVKLSKHYGDKVAEFAKAQGLPIDLVSGDFKDAYDEAPKAKTTRKKKRKGGAWKPVEVRADFPNGEVAFYPSMKEAARILGLKAASISKTVSNKGTLKGIKFTKVK